MGLFPETVAAALAGATVRAPFLFLFDFDGEPMRVWQGFGELPAGGHKWQGIGNLASVSGLEQPSQGQAPQATFVFSGVDATIVRLTRDEFTEKARFRPLRVFLQWMNDDDDKPNVLYDQPVQFWSGTMVDAQFDITGPTTRRITIKCESIFANRSRPNFSMNTDADQQRRYPGDLGMEFIGGLRNKVVTWPDF